MFGNPRLDMKRLKHRRKACLEQCQGACLCLDWNVVAVQIGSTFQAIEEEDHQRKEE